MLNSGRQPKGSGTPLRGTMIHICTCLYQEQVALETQRTHKSVGCANAGGSTGLYRGLEPGNYESRDI